jgi:glycosyltransferase involved in cell wall biosynthesis
MASKVVLTLFITKHLPYPPMGGSALRNWQNINIMMKLGSVAIFSISNALDELQRNIKPPPGVDLWSDNPIQPLSSQRSFWQKLEWWLPPPKHYLVDLMYRDNVSRELEKILAKFQPTLVIFEELGLYRYLPIVKHRGYRTILDDHNVEAPLFRENEPPVTNLKSKVRLNIEFQKLKSIERNFIRQVDQVWMCSNADVSLSRKIYGQLPHIRLVSNGINIADYDCVRLSNCTPPPGLEPIPQTLLFVATFSYPPNQVSAQLLIEQIFPRLQQIYPNCRLILAGKSPTPSMLEAAQQNSSLVVTGLVQDIRPYLSISSVVIVPLLQGGGTRLKILEAFAANRPVVSTTKGAEGLRVQDGKHLLVRDSVDELVAGVGELWENPSQGQTFVQNAYELVKAEYSWESIGKAVEQNVRELLDN